MLLVQRRIANAKRGIDGTDIRAGLTRLGSNGGPLTEMEGETNSCCVNCSSSDRLAIGAHTAPAVSAFAQLSMLEKAGQTITDHVPRNSTSFLAVR